MNSCVGENNEQNPLRKMAADFYRMGMPSKVGTTLSIGDMALGMDYILNSLSYGLNYCITPQASVIVNKFASLIMQRFIKQECKPLKVWIARVEDISDDFDCGAHVDDVVKYLTNAGYKNFSSEIGILAGLTLRYRYKDQPKTGIIMDNVVLILMNPVTDEDNQPSLLALTSTGSRLFLSLESYNGFIDKKTWVVFTE